MDDLFGVTISTGAVDGIYAETARRLKVFIAALVALLRSLPVLHADETTDRAGTATCWMHVVSTALFTLIHASATRGGGAIDEAGVLRGYRGVVVHDRPAMYWKLKAKHGVCGAHLLPWPAWSRRSAWPAPRPGAGAQPRCPGTVACPSSPSCGWPGVPSSGNAGLQALVQPMERVDHRLQPAIRAS